MCKLLLHPYNVLILDEPTNHLDLKAKAVLKEALQNFDGSLIVVSHDRDFLAGLTEFVYEVTPTRLKQYIGDIKNFLHEKHAESIGQYESNKSSLKVKKSEGVKKPSDSKLLRQATKIVQRLEKSIAKAEGALKQKNEEINSVDPNDRNKMTELSYEFEKLQKKLDDLLVKWEEAVEEIDSLN